MLTAAYIALGITIALAVFVWRYSWLDGHRWGDASDAVVEAFLAACGSAIVCFTLLLAHWLS